MHVISGTRKPLCKHIACTLVTIQSNFLSSEVSSVLLSVLLRITVKCCIKVFRYFKRLEDMFWTQRRFCYILPCCSNNMLQVFWKPNQAPKTSKWRFVCHYEYGCLPFVCSFPSILNYRYSNRKRSIIKGWKHIQESI